MTASWIGTEDDRRLDAFEETYCSRCGEQCDSNITWCDSYGENQRFPATAIRVRWMPEVVA